MANSIPQVPRYGFVGRRSAKSVEPIGEGRLSMQPKIEAANFSYLNPL
jgi:hypothetical protein